MNLESILEIVDTYDLSESQRSYVERKVSSRLDKLNNFTTAYSYISELVDFLNVPFGERRALRLDEAIKDSNTSKAHFFGIENKILFEKDERYRNQKISELSLQSLNGIFESEILEFFTLLVLNSGLEPEEYKEILKNMDESQIPKIANRLEVLKRGLFDKDEDYIIRGNIEVTSFSPFKIKFRNRRYGGDPLQFYREHQDLYEGMSRSELSIYDSGLYASLWKARQLNEAIPNIKSPNKISLEGLEEILSSYIPSEGVLKVASSIIDYSESTISKYWQENGLEVIGGKLKIDEREEIINSYVLYKGNITLAAKKLRRARATVARYWREAGLKSSHSKVNNDEKKKHMIVASYKPFNGNADKAAKELALTNQTITRYWRRAGLEVNAPGRNLSQEGKQEILKAYKIDGGIPSRAAKRLGRDFYTITKYWEEAGFKVKKRKERNN
ncbi:MAG: hypothetical protein KC589_08565, partial [Nanoarchaeota archaeon]|nr:hypothetical protein [Nanoarchaeota archaeon]